MTLVCTRTNLQLSDNTYRTANNNCFCRAASDTNSLEPCQQEYEAQSIIDPCEKEYKGISNITAWNQITPQTNFEITSHRQTNILNYPTWSNPTQRRPNRTSVTAPNQITPHTTCETNKTNILNNPTWRGPDTARSDHVARNKNFKIVKVRSKNIPPILPWNLQLASYYNSQISSQMTLYVGFLLAFVLAMLQAKYQYDTVKKIKLLEFYDHSCLMRRQKFCRKKTPRCF
jgi:hypothetical protein